MSNPTQERYAKNRKSLPNANTLVMEQKDSDRHEWRHFFTKAQKDVLRSLLPLFKGKFITRGNVLRNFLLFFEDFGAPL